MNYLAVVVNGQLTPKGNLTALDTNMIVMRILDAALESARTGKTIILKPLPQWHFANSTDRSRHSTEGTSYLHRFLHRTR